MASTRRVKSKFSICPGLSAWHAASGSATMVGESTPETSVVRLLMRWLLLHYTYLPILSIKLGFYSPWHQEALVLADFAEPEPRCWRSCLRSVGWIWLVVAMSAFVLPWSPSSIPARKTPISTLLPKDGRRVWWLAMLRAVAIAVACGGRCCRVTRTIKDSKPRGLADGRVSADLSPGVMLLHPRCCYFQYISDIYRVRWDTNGPEGEPATLGLRVATLTETTGRMPGKDRRRKDEFSPDVPCKSSQGRQERPEKRAHLLQTCMSRASLKLRCCFVR